MKGIIAGLDEVGMGSLAGPLVIVVTSFRDKFDGIEGVKDSKKINKKKMPKLIEPILAAVHRVGYGWAPASMIDSKGMVSAWQHAAKMALSHMEHPRLLMVDGTRKVEGIPFPQETYIKGDANYWQIGAASILAKVLRDREMKYYHKFYPEYGWDSNSGYGTSYHKEQILWRGTTPLHRKCFLKKLLKHQAVLSASPRALYRLKTRALSRP